MNILVKPVEKMVLDVIGAMARLNLTVGEVKQREKDCHISDKCLTGLITLKGEQCSASMALIFPEDVILHIANKMLPESRDHADEIITDLVGELSNMVLGCAKNMLDEEGVKFDLSLPSVIVGREFLIAHHTTSDVTIQSFSFDAGEFYVETSFDDES